LIWRTLALPDLRIADDILHLVAKVLVRHPMPPPMQPKLHGHIDTGDADDGDANGSQNM
jgi:hypothetical protein